MKNRHVSGAGVQGSGHPAPHANMPTKNKTTTSVSLGTTHQSHFNNSGPMPSPKDSGNLTPQSPVPASSSKPHLPSSNQGKTSLPLGTTKHGVGQVPGYLKGRK